ncbi:MAG: MerR family transcriptional regulator [Acidimicrobiaceae bacterium]|nr:MerR family transcriptional regulator [Acidimicrobiaceae bacterium]
MSQLVARTGVRAATIRYYLANGLLPPPVKAASNRFLYDERHVELVRLVRLLRERRHLTLEAIAGLLPDLLPDLLGRPQGRGVFRPEMWSRLLKSHSESAAAELAAARVLQAGLAAFARHGYSEVTIDDVCRAAGIAKGSFYRHFASKEDLFFAAARAAGAALAARLATALAGGSAVVEGNEALLADAAAPEIGIVLDLASLAARQRSCAPEVLDEVLARVTAAVRASLPASQQAVASGLVSSALGAALSRLAVPPTPLVVAAAESASDD